MNQSLFRKLWVAPGLLSCVALFSCQPKTAGSGTTPGNEADANLTPMLVEGNRKIEGMAISLGELQDHLKDAGDREKAMQTAIGELSGLVKEFKENLEQNAKSPAQAEPVPAVNGGGAVAGSMLDASFLEQVGEIERSVGATAMSIVVRKAGSAKIDFLGSDGKETQGVFTKGADGKWSNGSKKPLMEDGKLELDSGSGPTPRPKSQSAPLQDGQLERVE